MRLPQTFIPEKKQNINEILQEPKEEINPNAIEELLKSCKKFLEKEQNLPFSRCYELGEELANEIKYNKKDLEKLSQEITITEKDKYLGLYLSALVNKIIKEKEMITLKLDKKWDCLGAYLRKGILEIDSNIGNETGCEMTGGKIIIKGNAGYYTGSQVKNGELIIYGDTGEWTGLEMAYGEIYVEGEIESFDYDCKGKIYQRGRLIHPI